MKMPITIDQLKAIATKKNYLIYEDKLNIWGVRAADMTPNVFNDLIVAFYKKDAVWVVNSFKATTDPGLYWLKNPMNVQGAFIMAEYQNIDSHTFGNHHDYPALVQCNKLKGYRDGDKDDQFDLDPAKLQDVGLSGVNIHHAGQDSKQVDKWSAGCQVIANLNDWNAFYKIVLGFKPIQSKFSYTLINEKDFA